MTKVKAVLDTNIYLSGIIFGGNCRHLLDLVIKRKIIAVISPSILLEISQKLDEKFKWPKDQIAESVKTIAKSSVVVTPAKTFNLVIKDKSDNKILETAVESDADFIVTGDKHLLDFKKFQNIEIVKPADFIAMIFKMTR